MPATGRVAEQRWPDPRPQASLAADNFRTELINGLLIFSESCVSHITFSSRFDEKEQSCADIFGKYHCFGLSLHI
jgi:hypothetical protein